MKNTARQLLLSAASLAVIMGVTSAAFAQVTPAEQTGIAAPGRVEGQVKGPEMMPREVPDIEVRDAPVQGAPAGSDKITFKFNSLQLDGVTAYAPEELQGIYGDKIGTTITLTDLYVIANDLTRKYRNEGYILTQVVVPPQTIDGGTARLQVIEGFIGNIKVQSSEGANETDKVLQYLANIDTKGDPLNVKDLERSLLLINDLPGMKARSILSPSRTIAGAAEMLVIVERKPYDAVVSIDNFGTKFLGPVQLTAAGSLNSAVLHNNEKITAQVVYAPDQDIKDELAYFYLGYSQPVWGIGTMLDMYAAHSVTEPGYTLEQFDVEGRSQNFNVTLKHPFIRSRNTNLYARVGFDYRDTDTRNNLVGDVTREDKIRNFLLGARFEKLENLFGVAYNVIEFDIIKGVSIIGASEEGDTNITRPFADTTPLKLEAEFQRLQRVFPSVNLLLGVKGQLANDAVLSSEEFGVGGMSYGRGFDQSEVIGDDGIAGKIEVQWNKPYDLAMFQDYQLYGFFDAGRVWNDDATAANLETETLTSTGFGIRADFNDLTQGGLMVAFPLNNSPQTMGDRDHRVYFNLSRKF